MNIIKFKDIIIEGDEVFNSLYKGRYAFWPRLTYVCPVTNLSLYQDIEINGLPEEKMDENILLSDDYKDYIDMHETLKINDNLEYVFKNRFVTDDDITIDEVKQFRTWLATQLLLISSFPHDQYVVLNYYRGEMNDKIIETMKTVIKPMDNIDILNQNSSLSTCGCMNNTVTTNINSIAPITLCNPEDIYRKNIYNIMVEMFGSLDFWKEQRILCLEISRYIDNIVRLNLPLTKSTYMDEFMDCNCLNEDLQTKYIKLLEKTSECFKLIYNEETDGRKNYIADTLFEWASKLYEVMRWI